MNPDSAISAIRPSMIALVSTTICGSPRWTAPSSGSGRRKIPSASAAVTRSARLATVRPTIPSPRPIDTARGSQSPSGDGRNDSGIPRSSPIRRPITNSAVDSAWAFRMSHSAGTMVRYGRMAKPTTIQATTQAARKNP